VVRGEGDEGQRARSPATAPTAFVPPCARSYPLRSSRVLVPSPHARLVLVRPPRTRSYPPHSFILTALVCTPRIRLYPLRTFAPSVLVCTPVAAAAPACCCCSYRCCCCCCSCCWCCCRRHCCNGLALVSIRSRPPVRSRWPCVHPPILSPVPGSCVSALGFVCACLSFV
jgi:hypothetical protein